MTIIILFAGEYFSISNGLWGVLRNFNLERISSLKIKVLDSFSKYFIDAFDFVDLFD